MFIDNLVDILAAIADLGVICVAIYFLISRKRLVVTVQNGDPVTPGALEEREWKKRHGRFRDMEKDTEERPQVMPGPEPPVMEQTHTRRGEGYADGTSTNMDT
jgi:hypothetical protein